MTLIVRGHVSIEVRKVGTDWFGLSRKRMWTDHLQEEAEYDDESRVFYTDYKLHLLKFVVSIHPPAKLRNLVVRVRAKITAGSPVKAKR